MKVARTLRTLRHLRVRQLVDRVARRLRPLPGEPEGAGAYRLVAERPAQTKLQVPGMVVGEDTFTFLNSTLPFRGPDRWRPRGAPALWVYQQHYFHYLPQLSVTRAAGLIEDWLAMNPAGAPPAWDPYPISLRLREWLEWLAGGPEIDDRLRRRMIASIVHQAAVLESRLEVHLMANHLLENAIALCWAGVRLDGPLAERWRGRGLELLEGELAEQLLPDGAHYERSPMYQASIAESLLRLASVAGSGPAGGRIAGAARAAGERLYASLGVLCHPDGEYALVNDCALGQAPRRSELGARFGLGGEERRPAGGWQLAAAGFLGWIGDPDSYLIVDGGDLTPSYNPGHGHAAMLSFELSHRGRRLLTDTGVSTYEDCHARRYQRGTSAHNTIEVDGRDQSELWAAFRCGRRARIEAAAAAQSGSDTLLRAAYRGHLARGSKVRHAREIRVGGQRLDFADVVEARGSHAAVLRLHVAPGLRVGGSGGEAVLEERGGPPLARIITRAADWRHGTSPYHPQLGVEVERARLEARCAFRDRLSLEWSIELL